MECEVQELGLGRGSDERQITPGQAHPVTLRWPRNQSLRMDSSSLVGKETGNQMHLLAEMGLHSFFLSFPFPEWADSKQPASPQAPWF